MAAATTTVNIDGTGYTALSTGSTHVNVGVGAGQLIRLHMGSSAPAAATAAYRLEKGPATGERPFWIRFPGLGSTDNVYGMNHVTGSMTVVVETK